MKHNTGIYKIENKMNGKLYIGSSINLKNRLNGHQCDLRKNIHSNSYLQNAWNKYGEDVFEFSPVLYCDKKNLLFYEQRAINTYGFENLYNLSPTAGNTLGVKFSEATKQKISEAKKGEKNHLYGKHHTEDTRKKISEALKGKPSCRKGKHCSEATRKKMSEAHKGKARKKAEGFLQKRAL